MSPIRGFAASSDAVPDEIQAGDGEGAPGRDFPEGAVGRAARSAPLVLLAGFSRKPPAVNSFGKDSTTPRCSNHYRGGDLPVTHPGHGATLATAERRATACF